jgi:hypothetical protein
MVRFAEPATAIAGVIEVTVGVGGATIVNVWEPEISAGEFATVTDAVPAAVSNDAGTVACSEITLWNVVTRFVVVPPEVHCTTEVWVKLFPLS